MKSKPHHKVLASAINVAIVTTLSLPIYLLSGWEAMRIFTVILFFLYNTVFRKRCIGMMVAGTYLKKPATLTYVTLYTVSYSTIFWSWQAPCDLLLANALCQIFFVAITGNTAHGFIAGQCTVRA